MSRTRKDKPYKYRDLDAETVPRNLYGSHPAKAGHGNLAKGYEDGPGGARCLCCGVLSDASTMRRTEAKKAIRKALDDMKDE
jgi:hypothetical protein